MDYISVSYAKDTLSCPASTKGIEWAGYAHSSGIRIKVGTAGGMGTDDDDVPLWHIKTALPIVSCIMRFCVLLDSSLIIRITDRISIALFPRYIVHCTVTSPGLHMVVVYISEFPAGLGSIPFQFKPQGQLELEVDFLYIYISRPTAATNDLLHRRSDILVCQGMYKCQRHLFLSACRNVKRYNICSLTQISSIVLYGFARQYNF